MKELFGYLIIKKTELPGLNKAVFLAQKLSENDFEDILAGKKHLHANPVRKVKYPIPEREIRALVDE